MHMVLVAVGAGVRCVCSVALGLWTLLVGMFAASRKCAERKSLMKKMILH